MGYGRYINAKIADVTSGTNGAVKVEFRLDSEFYSLMGEFRYKALNGREAGVVKRHAINVYEQGLTGTYSGLRPGTRYEFWVYVQFVGVKNPKHSISVNGAEPSENKTLKQTYTGSFNLELNLNSDGTGQIVATKITSGSNYRNLSLTWSYYANNTRQARTTKLINVDGAAAYMQPITGGKDGWYCTVDAVLVLDTGQGLQTKTLSKNFPFVVSGSLSGASASEKSFTSTLSGLPASRWYARRIDWAVKNAAGTSIASGSDTIAAGAATSSAASTFTGPLVLPSKAYTVTASVYGNVDATVPTMGYKLISSHTSSIQIQNPSGSISIGTVDRQTAVVTLNGLNKDYSTARQVKFYCKKSSVTAWTYSGYRDLAANQTSQSYTFNGLLPGTGYNFKAVLFQKATTSGNPPVSYPEQELYTWSTSAVTKGTAGQEQISKLSLTVLDAAMTSIKIRVAAKMIDTMPRTIRLFVRISGQDDWDQISTKEIAASTYIDPYTITVKNLLSDVTYEFRATLEMSGAVVEEVKVSRKTAETPELKPVTIKAVVGGAQQRFDMDLDLPEGVTHILQISADGESWTDLCQDFSTFATHGSNGSYYFSLTAEQEAAMNPDADGNYVLYFRFASTVPGSEVVYSSIYRGTKVKALPDLVDGSGDVISSGAEATIDSDVWNLMQEAMREVCLHYRGSFDYVIALEEVHDGDLLVSEKFNLFLRMYDSCFPEGPRPAQGDAVHASHLLYFASRIREYLDNILT